MRELYVEKNFRAASMEIIESANEIIEDYTAQGFSLTLRQLYYQFVARDLIPNTEKSYNRIGSIINDGRLAGLISWDAIEDRTRNLQGWNVFNSPQQALEKTADTYFEDLWHFQPNYCEVWVEKEALAGVVSSICSQLQVPYFSCRGYVSQSEQWRAGKRLEARRTQHETVTIFHLGDHDPSGIDMTRDNSDRLRMFSCQRSNITVKRLALNMDQIEEYTPPPNPAKLTDSRISGYAEKYGYSSWELDALEPKVISNLIEDHVKSIIDEDILERDKEIQAENRKKITDFIQTLE